MMSNLKINDFTQVDLSSFTESDLEKISKLIALTETLNDERAKLEDLLATFTSYGEFDKFEKMIQGHVPWLLTNPKCQTKAELLRKEVG